MRAVILSSLICTIVLSVSKPANADRADYTSRFDTYQAQARQYVADRTRYITPRTRYTQSRTVYITRTTVPSAEPYAVTSPYAFHADSTYPVQSVIQVVERSSDSIASDSPETRIVISDESNDPFVGYTRIVSPGEHIDITPHYQGSRDGNVSHGSYGSAYLSTRRLDGYQSMIYYNPSFRHHPYGYHHNWYDRHYPSYRYGHCRPHYGRYDGHYGYGRHHHPRHGVFWHVSVHFDF